MTTSLRRGELTGQLLVTLRTLGKPVGDGRAPRKGEGAGWDGPPNLPTSTFTPFLVLSALTAGRSSGPFGDPQGDWQLPYMLEAFGVDRDQCEWMADTARDSLGQLRGSKLTLGDATYKVQQVRTDSIGGIVPVMVTDPPFFGQEDGITVWISKEIS